MDEEHVYVSQALEQVLNAVQEAIGSFYKNDKLLRHEVLGYEDVLQEMIINIMNDLELDSPKDKEDFDIRSIYYPQGVLNEAILEVINELLRLARSLADVVYDECKCEHHKAMYTKNKLAEHVKSIKASLEFLTKEQ